MDTIYECATNFNKLKMYTYRFVVAKNRTNYEIKLDFRDKDFFHLAGFHYLTDISIPRNRKNTLKEILQHKKITDAFLQKSRFYFNPEPNKNVKARIEELRYLEQYIDTDNFIRIYNTRNIRNLHSLIDADYIIESKLKQSLAVVYIFLKEREDNSGYYCVNSFFKKENVTYGGDTLYWMLKEKIEGQEKSVLYQHKEYIAI